MYTTHTPVRSRLLGIAVLSSALLLPSPAALAAERAMIILDGSGSMWGQINGQTKHEIARQALREVLNGAPPTLELGLMGYGHREKGNCQDIEVLVEPAAHNQDAIIRAAEQMKSIGKTPISAAVRQAADALRYTEDKATIILITDGLETCQADPCALGAELKETGVDLTAHVVGFDLTQQEGEQVACLAHSTGGHYLQAGNANELKAAMSNMVAALETPPAPAVEVRSEPPAEPAPLPSATVQGPVTAGVGTVIEVAWTGPDGPGDYITVVAQGAEPKNYGPYERTSRQSPVKLQLPDAMGPHEIRYIENATKTVLATQDIALTAIEATVKAPASAAAGSAIQVEWSGPNSPGDYITVVDVGAPDAEYTNYERTTRGSPLKLLMPDELGKYEVRYVLNASKRVLAVAAITLESINATLDVQNHATPGGKIIVAWTGPNNSGDYITIVPQGAEQNAYLDYVRTTAGSPLTLKAPAAAGDYEVRYVVNQSKRVLASLPVALSEAAAGLSAPSSVAAGAAFNVEWSGPGNRNDFIEIVAADAAANAKPLTATRTSQGSPLPISAPALPGHYQIRYMMRDTGEVVTHTPLIVE